MTFPRVFEPFSIRNLRLKNRIGEAVRDAYRCVLDLKQIIHQPEAIAC